MIWKSFVILFSIGFCFITGVSQNKNFPIEFNFQQRLVDNINHSSLKPLNERFHKIYYLGIYLDSNNYTKKVFKKLFQESLLEIHKADVHLSVDNSEVLIETLTYHRLNNKGK